MMRKSLLLQVVGLLLPNQTLASTVFWQVKLQGRGECGKSWLCPGDRLVAWLSPPGLGWLHSGKGLEGAGNKSGLDFPSHTCLCHARKRQNGPEPKFSFLESFYLGGNGCSVCTAMEVLALNSPICLWEDEESGIPWGIHLGRAGDDGRPRSQGFWECVCMAKPGTSALSVLQELWGSIICVWGGAGMNSH